MGRSLINISVRLNLHRDLLQFGCNESDSARILEKYFLLHSIKKLLFFIGKTSQVVSVSTHFLLKPENLQLFAIYLLLDSIAFNLF
jgi:hypothetical protein